MVTFAQWTASTWGSVMANFSPCWGPSGSGKTTCLRLIAGFEQLSGGAISIYGHKASELPPWQRDVNTVFQDYALFPHMSILDNVAYGLMVKGIGKKERHFRAQEALEKVAPRLCAHPQTVTALRRTAAAGGDCPCAGE
ncbi:Spermidine/putrescine import ATP-binding protein PotA [Raoultella planticola]|uniref:Spermidine/putrescine import ATP-binding protein PotA n=1 Tax=Raoultella planticola TaxID=575 RepID=A0A485AIH9_RAOPL|nr:Spermidine/putrescine import ATP-binding protein PotA [Raoultella planticola]